MSTEENFSFLPVLLTTKLKGGGAKDLSGLSTKKKNFFGGFPYLFQTLEFVQAPRRRRERPMKRGVNNPSTGSTHRSPRTNLSKQEEKLGQVQSIRSFYDMFCFLK